ncbi:hypothetical protein SAM23877_4006 [Streptomyces ambofaciens ATCC 23877]|uniref:Uncharacterized protein n=1 Tax=Streptomyces ambofaciens (strain ATCC 23877 / 3486 / DSM 40053 / JCM 4204 / NBRC 12836 / NRRL B-2516) TaxID=278992 RepID=A0A0K2AVY4_STRA7|nr:hypothetical protein SAM23877_4006 [Streptomyces ambofaciens ATCC 23877]
MSAYDAPSVGRQSDRHGNVTPGAYNPHGGGRVQLAWQRFSIFPRQRVAPPCGHPSGPSVPVWSARPAACR